ncbi:MAG: DUF5320 domain-containing protein [Deltaproteobacteria bacterium]|nr:DUF5320 domain-containing protein [Deltaproteobacteria bacterium]
MPGFDGTGPLGMGPLTGRGRGYCIVKIEENSEPMLNTTRIQNQSDSLQSLWENPSKEKRKGVTRLLPLSANPIKPCRMRRINNDYRSKFHWKRSRFTN